MGVTTLTRKQREIQEREELILGVAREMLVERGYLGLTMDRIAKAIDYSKGTVYQHFASKEDLLVAMAGQNASKRADMFERASTFRGRPRERMMGIGICYELFVSLYPAYFGSEKIINAGSVRAKATEQHGQLLAHSEVACTQIVSGIVRDAVAAGDLVLPDGTSPMDLCFNLWSLTFGAYFLTSGEAPLSDLGVTDPHVALMRGYHALLDGYGWRPLSTEWDYDATRAKIQEEVFSMVHGSRCWRLSI